MAERKPVRIPERVSDYVATLERPDQENISRLLHQLESEDGAQDSLVVGAIDTPLGRLFVAVGDGNVYATFLDEPDALLIVRADREWPATHFPTPM